MEAQEGLPLKGVEITDPFWRRVQELVRTRVIPYQWRALNDQIPDAEPSYCMHNFRAAAGLLRERRAGRGEEPTYTFRGFQTLPEDPAHPEPDRFYGFVFQDSDFAKWIEAVGYSLARRPDPALEALADGAIETVCAAQDESGYLDTYYILGGMDGAFTNLRDHHELYCLGHLIEGAVAYWQGTGKDRLLRAACRFADYVCRRFGPEPGQLDGYPGHEEAELALFRLYEATGEERYRRLACFFLDRRGTEPNYFDREEAARCHRAGLPYHPTTNRSYHQAHLPVRQQREAVGHAVRAVYLYSAMADAARLTGDGAMLTACRGLWESVTRQKYYLTGGIGATPVGEAFSAPYDLPNDSAYSETCAAIGLVFFAWRMLRLEPKGEYADVMEQALYNTVLAGMGLEGDTFFYVNPLSVRPDRCRREPGLSHVKPVRQRWFGCACCPPNLARMVSSLGAYLCSVRGDTLWLHLYVGGSVTATVAGRQMTFTLRSGLPWAGQVELTLSAPEPVDCTLALRIPGWCGGAPVTVEAPAGVSRSDRGGYCYLTGRWQPGDRIRLELPMPVLLRRANPAVRANLGRVAFTRGPVTYCMEQADNGPGLDLCRVDLEALGRDCAGARTEAAEILGTPVIALTVPGLRTGEAADAAALYTADTPPEETPVSLRLIPYFAWANRGEGEMEVWLRA